MSEKAKLFSCDFSMVNNNCNVSAVLNLSSMPSNALHTNSVFEQTQAYPKLIGYYTYRDAILMRTRQNDLSGDSPKCGCRKEILFPS